MMKKLSDMVSSTKGLMSGIRSRNNSGKLDAEQNEELRNQKEEDLFQGPDILIHPEKSAIQGAHIDLSNEEETLFNSQFHANDNDDNDDDDDDNSDKFENDDYEDDSDDGERLLSETVSPQSSFINEDENENLPTFTLEEGDVPEGVMDILKREYQVTKYNANKKIKVASKKERTWQIDILRGKMRNLDRKGSIKKEFNVSNLKKIEVYQFEPKKVFLTFKNEKNTYELMFNSNLEREIFYECCLVTRAKSILYCPSLCKIPPTCYVQIPSKISYKLNEKNSFSVQGSAILKVSNDSMESIKVFCGSWNLAGVSLPSDYHCISDFLPLDLDVYAISLQECGIKFNSKDTDGHSLCKYFLKYFGGDYYCVSCDQLWEIRMIVIAKYLHRNKITCVQSSTKATGFMNVCGNKGGIAISFKFNETSLCFVGCHLAAREEKIVDRNDDVHDISASMKLGIKDLDLCQFDYQFWMGDLNYRIDLPFEEGINLAQTSQYEKMLENDQLRKQMKCYTIFKGFKEGEVKFGPTYKFDIGTRNYSEEKCRTPSYCDRIIYKGRSGINDDGVTQLQYMASTKLTISDHSPVFSTFLLKTNRRFLSSFSGKTTGKQIVFSKVYVSDRTGSLLQKPLLAFYSTFFDESPAFSKAKAKKQTSHVNPRFDDDSLPILYPSSSHRDFLQFQKILIALYDDTATLSSTISADFGPQIVGYGALNMNIISLEEEEEEEEISFSIDLALKTKYVGKLNGCMSVTKRMAGEATIKQEQS